MALLLLFEKTDSLSYKELQATTKMAEDQFPRYVQSLLEAKLLNCNTEVNLHLRNMFGFITSFLLSNRLVLVLRYIFTILSLR